MTSQPGKKMIAMHILPNISKSKDNKTIKFVQLTKYNMRCGGESILKIQI